MQVNIFEAKTALSQLIKSAQAGEEVIIANRGQPVARLLAMEPGHRGAARRPGAAASAPSRRPQGATGGFAAWLERHPLPAYARRSAKAVDEAIAAERAAWD